MKAGLVAVVLALTFLGFGLLFIGDRSGQLTGTSFVLGLALLPLGLGRLVMASRREHGLVGQSRDIRER